jgi:hypothetical protein
MFPLHTEESREMQSPIARKLIGSVAATLAVEFVESAFEKFGVSEDQLRLARALIKAGVSVVVVAAVERGLASREADASQGDRV